MAEWWQLLEISPVIVKMISEAEKNTVDIQHALKENTLFNQAKVLNAFREEKISDDHFNSSEGYGYGDEGREKLEALFARVFRGEKALVRPHFVSGTHTLYTCLRGLLRPGDRLVSVTGEPYDTLSRALRGEKAPKKEKTPPALIESGEGALAEWNITFQCLQEKDFLDPEKEIEVNKILQEPTRVVYIQRSRGYNYYRKALTIEEMTELIAKIRAINPQAVIMVDNCYGEFVEKKEPLEAGADIIAGSLIKNPGGSLAPTGGYVAGKADLISIISSAASAPGLGQDIGAFVHNKRPYFQGLFHAPHLVGEALKGAVLIAASLRTAGYEVDPAADERRGDIVQAVRLKNWEELEIFCRAVQSFSPINSYVTPVPGVTAGYKDPILMAAGTFVQGSSSEFSADGPLREPWAVYIQGGVSYQHVLLGLSAILRDIL